MSMDQKFLQSKLELADGDGICRLSESSYLLPFVGVNRDSLYRSFKNKYEPKLPQSCGPVSCCKPAVSQQSSCGAVSCCKPAVSQQESDQSVARVFATQQLVSSPTITNNTEIFGEVASERSSQNSIKNVQELNSEDSSVGYSDAKVIYTGPYAIKQQTKAKDIQKRMRRQIVCLEQELEQPKQCVGLPYSPKLYRKLKNQYKKAIKDENRWIVT